MLFRTQGTRGKHSKRPAQHLIEQRNELRKLAAGVLPMLLIGITLASWLFSSGEIDWSIPVQAAYGALVFSIAGVIVTRTVKPLIAFIKDWHELEKQTTC